MVDRAAALPEGDRCAEIVDAVRAARAQGTALFVLGNGSKRGWLGRDCAAREFSVAAHRGIVDYQPGELVVTARAGTTVAQLEAALAAEGQALAFEPPRLDGRATLGGTLACNLSGPARPWTGSMRDAVLGVQLVNGRGELLNFGGRVMKNVAGYDVSRLQAGALGTLGILTAISLRVAPLPEDSLTLAFEMPAQAAIDLMNRRAGEPAPLSGACWIDGHLYLRLSGARSAVRHTAARWGGDTPARDEHPWENLREMTLPGFSATEPLWRLSHAPTAPPPPAGRVLLDWAGAQRWVGGDADGTALQEAARRAGGHALLFRGGDRSGELRAPLEEAQQRVQRRLKRAFDPDGVLNPGRLYAWL